jgi:hypothetical protein
VLLVATGSHSLTAREGELAAHDTVARALSASAEVERVRPEALSESAVAELLARAFSEPLDRGFASVCHRVTGGNPLLLRALIADLRVARTGLGTASIEVLDRLRRGARKWARPAADPSARRPRYTARPRDGGPRRSDRAA